jgi:serine phosphatase RsbU (regulator of sigma subunit)
VRIVSVTDSPDSLPAAGSVQDPGGTAFLVEASNQLMSSLNVERSLEITATLAARHLAEVAVVVAPPSRRRISITRATRAGAVERQVLRVDPAEVPGLSEALQGFPPVPSRWIDPATAPDWLVPHGLEEPGSLIVTPLPGNGIPAGALILLRGRGQERFTESEEALARVFAARAGAAISAALLFTRQSALARTLAEDLMPPRLTRMEGVELAGGFRPASDEQRLGGDFYDVHGPVPGDPGVLVVFGDVCGNGVAAAMLAGKIRTSIAALRTVESDHERMLQLLNRALLSSRHTRFATLVLASARRVADGVAVRATCGGHPPPLVVRNDGTVERTTTRGTLIGAVEPVRATSSEILLAPGETCLLYSDGITEAVGGLTGTEFYGSDRLEQALAGCAGLPAEAVVERVQMLAEQWLASNRRDDMAVVAITAPMTPMTPMTPMLSMTPITVPVSNAAVGDIRAARNGDHS